jgi:membrane-bound lytic murein transglycosylase F
MKIRPIMNWQTLKLVLLAGILLGLVINLGTCSPAITPMQDILATGQLRVVTRENPATYFVSEGVEDGFEYDLAKRFADYLGVELVLYSASVSRALKDVENGRAHIGAAGLSVSAARKLSVDFGPAYQETTQVLLGRRGKDIPEHVSELPNFDITVLADSSHLERMIQLQANFPDLHWEAQSAQTTIGLMKQVESSEFDLTVVDSGEFAVTQRYFPLLKPVFNIAEPEEIAWAMPKESNVLGSRVSDFFSQLEDSGDLDQLKEYHFGYIQSFDYVEVTSFMRDMTKRLPGFQELFYQAGEKYKLDWKLLAAISYQESHWRENAVSPTGVKGLMMLTSHTAEEMGVTDREIPEQSIDGGTRYLLKMLDKIPERIEYPDRLWFALAGYNVGFGHLEDARVLTERDGKNPDLWSDVREYLPLLSDKKYYSTVKRGKARGNEPVKYVENIRDYYDLLRWLTREEKQSEEEIDSEENMKNEII